MLGLEKSFLNDYGVTMPVKGIAAISGPYDFYPFEYDEVRSVFGQNDNPEGTQPINLVAPDRPPMLMSCPVRVQVVASAVARVPVPRIPMRMTSDRRTPVTHHRVRAGRDTMTRCLATPTTAWTSWRTAACAWPRTCSHTSGIR